MALNEVLERRVAERTQALAAANQRLQQEIAERERAEAAVRRTEQLFRLLVQGVTDYALYMLDPNGIVTSWNTGAERIKGYTTDEILGQSFARFYTPEDAAAGEPARALKAARERGRDEHETWHVRKDGSRFWANVVIDSIYDEDGTLIGFAKITRDVTERRRTQEDLDLAREALFQSRKMEAIGQLTGGVAHDFNNILTGIIGALDLVRRRLEAGRTGEILRYVEVASTAANRAASLTARLLAFGRRQPLTVTSVDLNGIVLSMADLLRRTMGEAIEIEIGLEPDLPCAATDVNQIENAILNLAINARDAMPAGGRLTIRTEREPPGGTAEGPGFVFLTVADTGRGMDTDVREKAFEPFFTTKALGQGTGLGLSMIYGFMKQIGGNAEIASEPGAGTLVRLTLPIAAADPTPREVSRDEAAPVTSGAGETILLVEDDPDIRALAQETLREQGYRVIACEDAAGARTALRADAGIALLVTDFGLPGGTNGRALAAEARAMRPSLPIILMTGYADEAADRPDFLGPGMVLLTKPFALDTFTARVRGSLDG
ncbi:PAS domain S-box protein [Rhizobiales bacterium Sp-1]|uniref:histidine kinase n=2 Tax=Segnochrobactrum spirostomi TaxID=2608987 RepID=A0A6A7Y1J0_9HYPH|nr:PAS domain S-box protein [Segnochrobactrum spirostomi]